MHEVWFIKGEKKMKKIDLLFITTDRRNQLERSTHYLIEELKKKSISSSGQNMAVCPTF